MDMIRCPHCKARQIFTGEVPKHVVIIMPCPVCHELMILFQGKLVGLNRAVIEHGSRTERVGHLAQIINQFIEAGLFPAGRLEVPDEATDPFAAAEQDDAPGRAPAPGVPITRQEVERFVKVELRHLDNADYFREHFG